MHANVKLKKFLQNLLKKDTKCDHFDQPLANFRGFLFQINLKSQVTANRKSGHILMTEDSIPEEIKNIQPFFRNAVPRYLLQFFPFFTSGIFLFLILKTRKRKSPSADYLRSKLRQNPSQGK